MHECVVKGGIDVGDTEDILAFGNLRAESNDGLFLWGLRFFRCLKRQIF